MNEFTNSFLATSYVIADAMKLIGRDCLNEICRVARQEFGARTAIISSLRIVESELLFTEAHSSGISDIVLDDYQTCNRASCKVLASNDTCVVLDDATSAFPKAPLINQYNSKAYIGFPLVNRRAEPIGVFAMEWPTAISAKQAEHIKAILSPFLPRITEELRRVNTSTAFERLISPVAPKTSTNSEIFRMIVTQAAELSGVHTVQLLKNCGDDPQSFRVLASYSNGKLNTEAEGENIPYKGTACVNMIQQDVYFHERNVLNSYPHAKLMRNGTQSYLGFGFRNAAGQTIGHIAFTHNRPMSARATTCRLMQMLSSRAGLELQRYDLELEHKAMETALRVRSKLESLGIMAGTIAHDFNNQLAAMIGNTELALIETTSKHPAQEYLKAAEESMWRARDVIGELMDFAGNNPSVAAEPVALGEIVSSTLNDFRPRLTADLRIHPNVKEGLPNVMARRVHLIQILSNLVANSLDASNPGQKLNIEVRAAWADRAEIDPAKCLTGHCANISGPCIVLEVRDTGAGMDNATAEHVFDPYFSTKGVSRGLGLSSVLGLSRRHGIGLTFESKPGKGTVFSLYFSALEEGASRAPQIPSVQSEKTAPDSRRKSVLVVDDESSVQEMVSKIMATLGHDVHRASSGEEAIKMARAIPNLDLAIIDVVMPGLNGFETMSELRKTNEHLPAIMVSGFSERNLSDRFSQDETTKFLVKPFSITTVRSIVSELVG